MRVAMGLIHRGRGLDHGLGFTMATTTTQAAADIATGEGVGSAIYEENLAAAQQQPDFNQAQFDAWWACQTSPSSAPGSCAEPTFVAYAGTAPSNRPAVLPSNVIPSVTPVKTTAKTPVPTTTTKKKTVTTSPAPATPAAVATPSPPPITQQQMQAATTTPPASAGLVPTSGTTVSTSFLTDTSIDGIPNWVLLAGIAGIGLVFFMRGR